MQRKHTLTRIRGACRGLALAALLLFSTALGGGNTVEGKDASNLVPMVQWLAERGLSGSSDLSPHADPANRGIPNLLAYLLNIHPTGGGTHSAERAMPRVSLAADSSGGPQAEFSFRVNRQARDLEYTVEVSETLSPDSWAPLAEESMERAGEDSETGDPIYRTRMSMSENQRKFFRLRAESTRPLAFVAAADAPHGVRDEADHIAEGAGDHAVIQSVIDAFPAEGGDIFLSEGVFEVSAPIDIPSGVNLVGAGKEETLLRLDPGQVSLGLHTGVLRVHGKDAVIRDLSIDASNPDNRVVEDGDNRSSGIYLDIDSENALLENIAVRNTTRHGIAVLGRGHTLRNIRAEKVGRGYCVSIGDGSRARPGAWDIRAENLFVRDSGGRSGIEINDGVDGVVIDGFYSGGHGNPTRGTVHIREHRRDDEFVRNVVVRNGVIDLRDTTVDYEDPGRHGFRIVSTREKNPIENIVVENIEFRYVDGHGVSLQGNLDGIHLKALDPVDVGGEWITVESFGGMTPQNVTVDGVPYETYLAEKYRVTPPASWDFGSNPGLDGDGGFSLAGENLSAGGVDQVWSTQPTALRGERSVENPYNAFREFSGVSADGSSFVITGEFTVNDWNTDDFSKIGLGILQEDKWGAGVSWREGLFVAFFRDQRLLIRPGDGHPWLTDPDDPAFKSGLSTANGTTYQWEVAVNIDPTGTTMNIAATLSDDRGNSHTSSATANIADLPEFGDWIGFGGDPQGGDTLQFDQKTFAVIPESAGD